MTLSGTKEVADVNLQGLARLSEIGVKRLELETIKFQVNWSRRQKNMKCREPAAVAGAGSETLVLTHHSGTSSETGTLSRRRIVANKADKTTRGVELYFPSFFRIQKEE